MLFGQEILDGTEWDVVINGTGIHQSLLALALSRSGKKILHVDENPYYGGAEAAFSLQEAEEWANSINEKHSSFFSHASIDRPAIEDGSAAVPRLARSSAYTLCLAPQLIYNESRLISYLISSKTDKRMEFLAMGSWWIYSRATVPGTSDSSDTRSSPASRGKLVRIPTNREDVAFNQGDVDLRGKRALMRILRFVLDYENQSEIWEPFASRPLPDFLLEHFKLPLPLHNLLLALTACSEPPQKTLTSYALPRIALHLRSIGRFGRGFSSIIPKYGGLSEIVQVACRACAVGEGVYVLGRGVTGIHNPPADTHSNDSRLSISLVGNETVKTEWIAGTDDDFRAFKPETTQSQHPTVTRSVSIVGSTLATLFPWEGEGTFAPAGSIVVFPSESLPRPEGSDGDIGELPPVYIVVHTADTAECPSGQTVLYASVSLPDTLGKTYLSSAVRTLLDTLSTDSSPRPQVLWSMHYQQHQPRANASVQDETAPSSRSPPETTTLIRGRVITLPPPSPDLVFDDSVFDHVKAAWRRIMGADADESGFLVFEHREAEMEEAPEEEQDEE